MSKAWPILVALLVMAAGLLAPVLVLLALPFARWDSAVSLDSNGQGRVQRGDLSRWAAWLSTPDERLPGGTYEPKVARVLARCGRFCCSWYWLGVRNRLHGLAFAFARPLTMPWSPVPGYYEAEGLWWLRKPLLGNRLQLKAGWRTYRVGGRWWGVPCCSITRP